MFYFSQLFFLDWKEIKQVLVEQTVFYDEQSCIKKIVFYV